MILPKTETAATRARQLRRRSTPAESALWLMLRNRRFAGLKFRRQVPCGPYILDFYCTEHKLAIELDGSAHLPEERRAYDQERTRFLESLAIQVIRIDNEELALRPEAIVERLRRSTLVGPHPDPLPQGEGEKKRP